MPTSKHMAIESLHRNLIQWDLIPESTTLVTFKGLFNRMSVEEIYAFIELVAEAQETPAT